MRERDGVGEGVDAVVAADEGVVGGQGRAGAAAGEVDGAGVARRGVAVGVLGGDGDRERRAGGRACGRGDGQRCWGCCGDRDRAAGAGDRGRHRVRRGDGAVTGLRQRDAVAEGVDAVVAADERVVRWEGRAGATTGEVHDAGVAGRGVPERIERSHRRAECNTRSRAGRRRHRQRRRGCSRDGDW